MKALKEHFKTQPSLSEFVDWCGNKINEAASKIPESMRGKYRIEQTPIYFGYTWRYHNFLKQPLELNMLVPCENGLFMEEPQGIQQGYKKRYQEALSNVIYEGLEPFGDEGDLDFRIGKIVLYKEDGGEIVRRVESGDLLSISDMQGQPITPNFWDKALKG